MKARKGGVRGNSKTTVADVKINLRVREPTSALQDMRDNLGNLAAINEAISSQHLLNEGVEGANIPTLRQHIEDYLQTYRTENSIPTDQELSANVRRKLVAQARSTFDYYSFLQGDFDPAVHINPVNRNRIFGTLSDSFNEADLKKHGFVQQAFTDATDKRVLADAVILANVSQKLEGDYMEKDFVDGKKQEAAILTANPLDEEGITTFREKYKPMSIQKKLSKKLNDLIDVLDKFNKAMPEKYGEQLDLKELLEKLYDKIEKSPVNETLKSLAADIGNLLFENINIDGLQFKEKVRLIEAVGRYIENPNTNDARVCRDWILSASIKFGVEDHDINQIIAKLPALLEAHKLEKKSDQRQEQKSDQRQEQLFTQAKTGEPGEIEKTEQSPVIKWYPE